jgi:hypothetical protein
MENMLNHPVLKYPFRSPLVVAEKIKDIINGKVVCDVGCAYGDLMIELSRHCRKVVGVEHEFARAEAARSRGLEVSDGDIPEADVYYVWVNSWGLVDAMEKLKDRNGILILVEEARDPSLGGYELEIEVPEYEIDKKIDFTRTLHLQVIER